MVKNTVNLVGPTLLHGKMSFLSDISATDLGVHPWVELNKHDSLAYLLLFPLWLPVGGGKEHEKERERETTTKVQEYSRWK